MKKLYPLIILAAILAPQGMWAQSSIEDVLQSATKKYERSNIKEDHRVKTDPDGSTASTDVYTFTKMQDSDVDDFIDAFRKDSKDAYFTEKSDRNGRSVLLGDNVIGRDYDWHHVVCFEDPGNEDYRYGYALEWNNNDNDCRLTIEHGERPRQNDDLYGFGKMFDNFDSFLDGLGTLGDTVSTTLRDITWDDLKKYVEDAVNSVDWRQLSDSVARAMKTAGDSVSVAINGIEWKVISDSVSKALNRVDWGSISDSMSREFSKGMKEFADSMEKFGNDFPGRKSSRPEKSEGFLKKIHLEPTWGEKIDALLDSTSPKSTEDISKIYDLCKNHPADLSKDDRDSYIASLKDLRKRTDDRMQRRMLSASIKCLKQ